MPNKKKSPPVQTDWLKHYRFKDCIEYARRLEDLPEQDRKAYLTWLQSTEGLLFISQVAKSKKLAINDAIGYTEQQFRGNANFRQMILWTVGTKTLTEIIAEQVGESKATQGPPAIASSLVCWLAPAEDVEVLLGDLAEDFKRLRKKHGLWTAQQDYWRQTLSIVRLPLARLLKRVATVVGLEEFLRYLLN